MRRAKRIAWITVAVLLLIVIFQNTDPVTTRILFFSWELPKAVLLSGTFLLGLLCGMLVMIWRNRNSDPEATTEPNSRIEPEPSVEAKSSVEPEVSTAADPQPGSLPVVTESQPEAGLDTAPEEVPAALPDPIGAEGTSESSRPTD